MKAVTFENQEYNFPMEYYITGNPHHEPNVLYTRFW